MMSLSLDNILRDPDGFIRLKYQYSELFRKRNYLTKKNLIIDRIYEYDIRSANVSALRWSDLFQEDQLDVLESLPKMEREVAVGKLIRSNKQFQRIIHNGIFQARERLFRYNHIQDNDVLSIKNDAVFIIGRNLKECKFGPMEFRKKNQYAAFMKLDKLELYYDRKHKTVDIKGVRDEVVEHPDHQEGMIQFFVTAMNYLVMDQRPRLREYLIEFVHDYKNLKLPYQYYRELNRDNCYRTKYELTGYAFNLDQIEQDQVKEINITYNYMRFILPLTQMLM